MRPNFASASWPATWKATLLLCLVGVVLPNALSLGALIFGIGVPPRTSAILAYATLALVARIVPFWATVALFVAIVIYDAVATIALLFGLAPQEIVTALHLSGELKLFDSPLYRGIALAAAAVLAANFLALKRIRSRLQGGNALVMIAVALAFAGADFITNTSAHYQFGTLYAANKPMESAAGESGFRKAALSAERNVLLIVVESLGHFADPDRQAILTEPFRDPALLGRYAVTTGSTTYYGSTTAAEMRELCDTREPYEALLEGKTFDCLPHQMAARGYDTVGMHNFTRNFFERGTWYPRVGLRETVFGEDFSKIMARRCGGPFKGICDVDVLPVIARKLREAAKPTFAYWMTLSTHVPIAPKEGTPTLGCQDGGGAIGQVEVCYMTELWLDLFRGITAMTAEIPPTEILLVGDHAPPLWSKTGRGLFTPGKVSWVRLRPLAQAHAGVAGASPVAR